MSEPIIGGVRAHRPEVVDFLGGCTGTLIGSRWVLSAAHCGNYQEAVNDPLNPDLDFVVRTSTDGANWGVAPGSTLRVERLFNMSRDTLLGAPDIVLARLATAVPPAFLERFPALSSTRPTTGWVTLWGRGCNSADGSGFGPLRHHQYFRDTADEASTVLCPGDSGGPARHGRNTDGGAIWGVNSHSWPADGFGDVVAFRTELNNIMSTWDARGSTDISFSASFCPATSGELFWVDSDGDGDLEALCRDSAAGVVRTSRTVDRLVAPLGSVPQMFCTRPGGEMHVGDVNGDGRSDVVCRDPSSRGFEVMVGTATGAYVLASRRADVTWCTHAAAVMHLGDWNMDGRTDLLCKDPGRIWIDYAGPGGSFDFATAANEFKDTIFCTHRTAKLYTGDFNGDARTDLLCLTGSSGGIHIDLADGGAFPFTGEADDWTFETPPEACRSGDILQVMDADGDGKSDLYCTQSGSPSTIGSVRSSDITPIFDYEFQRFGWSRSVRPRAMRVASQPWQRTRPL